MKTAIVVGAGAGGCAAAAELAKTHKVTLLERGTDFSPFAFSLPLLEPLRRTGAFFDPRMISLLFGDMRVEKSADQVHVYGRGIGGTTNLATANVLRYDASLRELGIDLDEEFEELAELVPQITDHQDRWSPLTKRLFSIFEELGFDPSPMPKMLDLSACQNCGLCVLGCKHGAKWTADRLLDTVDVSRLEIVRESRVDGLIIEDGEARGVACNENSQATERYADVIVLAAGGIGTPRILQASGIETQTHFFGDPVLCVAASMPDAHADAGIPMPFASQREGYILSPYFDYLSFFFHKDWRKPANSILSLMIKLADDEAGAVLPSSIETKLTEHDIETYAHAVNDCLAVLHELGIEEDETFLGLVNEGHPGGTLPLTRNEAQSLHNPALPSSLYIADSTLFPQSMGNPPILTIMALAKKVAKVIAS